METEQRPLTEYEIQINSLIEGAWAVAEEKANALVKKYEDRPGIDGSIYRHFFDVEFFHKEMNRRAFEAGLRCWK